jgi:hypothetical protein
MKLTAKDRNVLRNAAAVADAQQELVALQKSRREGRPIAASTAGPLVALLFASMAMMYFSVMAITSEREAGQAPIFLSGDIEQPLTPG